MPTLPSLHHNYDGDTSDNDKDTAQHPSSHNRHDKTAESDSNKDSRYRPEKASEPDNDENTDDSDYDSSLTGTIATENKQMKECARGTIYPLTLHQENMNQ